jgi:hypothetical protein
MSPEEQEALAVAARRQQIQQVADQARDAAIAARRQGGPASADLARQLQEAADYYADGEAPGSPFDELAGYLRAVLALLHGQPLPPVASAFAGHLAAIQAA